MKVLLNLLIILFLIILMFMGINAGIDIANKPDDFALLVGIVIAFASVYAGVSLILKRVYKISNLLDK